MSKKQSLVGSCNSDCLFIVLKLVNLDWRHIVILIHPFVLSLFLTSWTFLSLCQRVPQWHPSTFYLTSSISQVYKRTPPEFLAAQFEFLPLSLSITLSLSHTHTHIHTHTHTHTHTRTYKHTRTHTHAHTHTFSLLHILQMDRGVVFRIGVCVWGGLHLLLTPFYFLQIFDFS